MSGTPVPQARPPPYEPPEVSGARIAGAVSLTLFYFGLVGILPYYLEAYAVRYGLAAPIEPAFLLIAGFIVALLAGLSVATKPTRAWGPVRVMSAGFDLIYVVYLLQNPVYTTTIRGFALTITYGHLLELFLIPPAIGLLAGIVTTLGDVRRPWERISFQFPQRSSAPAYG